MTSPGSEHVSRYRALGEFDNLIRAAREAKRALKELREEEAKLNAQSLADDKKVTASKQARAQAEKESADSAKKATQDLNRGDAAGKAGETAGTSYSRGMGKGIEKQSQSSENKRFLEAATGALKNAFAKAGDDSGKAFTASAKERIGKTSGSDAINADKIVETLNKALAKAGDDSGQKFLINVKERFKRDSSGIVQSSGFEYSLREFVDKAGRAGEDTGNRYITGFASKIKNLNEILPLLGQDKLNLDVDTDDAIQSMKALEFELNRLAHTTVEPRVRIDANRALDNLRGIQKLFKDEVAETIIKESQRIQEELRKVDELPSGKAFKFWTLTALSDMARVFDEADRGTSVFNKLRLAISNAGGGNSLRTLVSGFDQFSETSSQLLQRLGRVSGELYRMPGLIGVLVSAIPALVSGLGALGGGAGSLASALGAATGVLAAGPGVIAAFGTATFALKDTFGGLKDALSAARKAQQQEAEAKEKARLGTTKALTEQQKYKLIMDSLGESTEAATLKWVDYTEAYANVQKSVQDKFFKEVVGSMGDLYKLLGPLENLLGKSATAVGKLAAEGIKMITSGPWKRDFATIADNNVTVITNLGKAGFSLINVFRNIAVAAGPFTSWLTKGIQDGAKAFENWSNQARNGTIQDFLEETKESLQSLWQILKNLGSITNSIFQSTVDEGQRYLRTLEDITGRWADVAKAQQDANSPLRTWLLAIRPVMSSLGALIGDLVKGIAGLATNQSSITTMIQLLDTLRTQVLPPILDILQHLNDSGIAVTVVNALGEILEAIAVFLDSGATQALTVFVTVFAGFVELVAEFASLPGVSDILGGLAAGIAALAAVSVVARFTGLFKLWDFLSWLTRNRGNLSGAFSDVARGVAGLPTQGVNVPAKNVPSTISLGPIGSEIGGSAKETERMGTAAQNAAPKVTTFSRALGGISGAGSLAKGALTGITSFLGGPWGVALTAATIGIGFLLDGLVSQKREAEDTKTAFLALKDAYAQLKEGNTDNVSQLAATDEKFRQLTENAKQFGLSLTDVSGALNNNDQNLDRVNAQLDTQIATYERLRIAAVDAGGPTAAIPYKELKDKAIEFKDSINEVARAQGKTNEITKDATGIARSYEERLAGMTQAQVDNAVQVGSLDSQIRTLSNALDVMASATSSASDRSKALSDIINSQTKTTVDAFEADEQFNSSLINLRDTVEANRSSLGKHEDALGKNTRAGLQNRDALEQAAKSTRDLFLADIASGKPMNDALKRHQDRIKELRKEADDLGLTRAETNKLIKAYGDVPEDVKTKIIGDPNGFQKVYRDLQRLQYMQNALRLGLSPEQAEREYNKARGIDETNRRRNEGVGRSPSGTPGDGYGIKGYATGGPVWGAGTRTSDSIRAWLSNGEFVQPTDAVEHYGIGVMEALRKKKLDRSVIEEALPDKGNASFSSGGQAHSHNCPACSSGGHKFAQGGSITVPYKVDVDKTKIDKDWVYSGLGGGWLGMQNGSGGVGWMMRVLRARFPGLPLISGFRPGSRTLSGNRSYHSLGRAVDLPPRRDVAEWIRANYGARTKELITPYNDLNLHNGKSHRYTGAIWNQHNFAGGNAHDHWAFNQGGLVDLMNMMNMQNLAPQKNAPLPTTPRSLSPAASSVVNNSTDNTRTFGDVIINNPMPERAGDSIRDSLYRTQLLYG